MFAFYNDLVPAEKRAVRRLGVLFAILLNVFTLALIASYGFSAWREAKGALGIDRRLEISINGEGKVSAKPDIAKVSASIVVERELLPQAQAEASRRSTALVAALVGQDIAERDIRTAGYNIFPQYSYPRPCYAPVCPAEERPRIVGYQVRMSYEVKVRDISKAGDVLAGMVGAGVNEVGNLEFTIDDPEALKAEARAKAVADALKKARALAADLGKRVGRMTAFAESGGAPPSVVFTREAGFGGKGGGEGPAVPSGEGEIAVTVGVTYEFR